MKGFMSFRALLAEASEPSIETEPVDVGTTGAVQPVYSRDQASLVSTLLLPLSDSTSQINVFHKKTRLYMMDVMRKRVQYVCSI